MGNLKIYVFRSILLSIYTWPPFFPLDSVVLYIKVPDRVNVIVAINKCRCNFEVIEFYDAVSVPHVYLSFCMYTPVYGHLYPETMTSHGHQPFKSRGFRHLHLTRHATNSTYIL